MTGRVLVTGISGFIGSHVALALLNAGYEVRGSLRDMRLTQMLARAGADIGRLECVRLDLLDDSGWTEAMAGCRYLQHVASPLAIRAPRDRELMIRPAVDGTRRALEAALEANVERIVLTSSVSSISYGHDPVEGDVYTDADWSATGGPDVTAYSESKTRAELEAWSIMEENGRRHDLAVINPTIVLGPLLGSDLGTSAKLVRVLLDGRAPLAPRMSFNVVDVRDIAALHLNAMTHPRAGGHRHIANAGPASLLELAAALRPAFPAYAGRMPRFAIPDWAVRLYALIDPDARALLGRLGTGPRFDAGPAAALLGRPFITPRLAAAATAQSLIDFGLVRPPGGGNAPQKKG
jgi:nucleoside-diphosphate-sugar epimerase